MFFDRCPDRSPYKKSTSNLPCYPSLLPPYGNIQKSVELNGRASCNVWPKDGVSMLGRDYRNFVVTIMAW